MLGSSILDVAIGMVFIYLLLSLIASAILEALSSIVQARSANLERGIRSLFSGGTLEDDKKSLVDLIYTHGLIRGLYRDPLQEDAPSSAPAKKSWFRDGLRRVLGMPEMQEITGVSDKYLLPAYIPARTFSITLLDILSRGNKDGIDSLLYIGLRLNRLCAVTKVPATLEAAATPASCNNNAAEALRALFVDAYYSKDPAGTFRVNIENWYNDAMDRVSGWYKNHAQKILIVIGLGIAIVFNVDSIRVGRTLWLDRDARQGLVNAASAYTQKNGSLDAAAKNGSTSDQNLTEQLRKTVQAFDDVSSEYLLPVGWHYSLAHYEAKVIDFRSWDLIHIVEQLLGWIITALALSLGAPFWFDLLNKFMVVRSTVKPQEKSRVEDSKD
jgi:hypothetical protein